MCCPRKLLNTGKVYFHFQESVIHFVKEYKPRSCVTLRLIDAPDGTFSGKHWKVILYRFVLDFTAVNAGVGSFTTLHIIIHVIQHALSD